VIGVVERLTYIVKEIIDETHDVKTLRIAPESGKVFDFKPGQFVNLALKIEEGKPPVARPYSISSSPTDKDYLALTIKIPDREKSFPKKVAKLKPREKVYISGPFGVFTFDEQKHKHLVMIAGGVGITPFHSVVRYCTGKKLTNKLNLLYSNKTHEDVIFHDDFERFQKENPNFTYVCTLTREDEAAKWKGCTGRIDADMINKYGGADLTKAYYMLCGSNGFVKAFKDLLLGMNIPKEQILYELFGEGV